MKAPLCVVVFAFFCSGLPAGATSEELDYNGVGVRAGMTIRPDQFHFGGHVDLGEFTEGFRFQPNVEIGLGEDRTLLAFNAEGLYFFDRSHRWTPYTGGGIGVHLDRHSKGVSDSDRTITDVGLNVLAGLERSIKKDRALFVETKIGIDDAPDFKLTVGMTFFKKTE
ncbi:MAG: hypothetical protein HY709_05495 [Candidatus Latescibacteria bacterium]|nr:hypothetical protein [Candidatus Latescibacterota bacterium]